MNDEVQSFSEIAKELKAEFSKLSDFEALSLAIQIERNQILEKGLVISRTNKNPSALEAIAISLGYTDESKYTIANILQEISSK